jgi:hypothetical protein
VSYWVDLALGQGEFPRDPFLSHVKWVKWLGSRLKGHRAHDIQEAYCLIHGCLCRGCVVLSSANALFPSPLFAILLLFHNFKEILKVTALAWCPDNGNVTHKHLVEMRRLARDETPFLSTMQLRAITLVW